MRAACVFVLMMVSALAARAGDMPAGTMPSLAARCLPCHGAEGRPALADVPIIHGQQPAYLAQALRAYRDGGRAQGQALVMGEIARPLADAEIEALAQWFGAQK